MVGWSRRNAEASARRARWWATLTEEERAAVRAREAASDRVAIPILVGLMSVALFALAGFLLGRLFL